MEFNGRKTAFEKERDGDFIQPERLIRELGESYIYAIKCNEFVKIGIGVDPNKRMLLMQTGNPYKLKLLKAWESNEPLVDEECLHAQFESYRVRGEWFKLPKEELEKLLSLDTLESFRI